MKDRFSNYALSEEGLSAQRMQPVIQNLEDEADLARLSSGGKNSRQSS